MSVDPGWGIGLSIFCYGVEIVISVYNSIEELVLHVIVILSSLRAKRKILKIRDGNMHVAKQIVKILNIKYCSLFELEFVNERKTSIKIKNFNQRG